MLGTLYLCGEHRLPQGIRTRTGARARTHPGTRGIGSFILLSRSVRNTRFNFERSRPSRKSELRHAGRYNIYVGNRTLSRKAHDRARTRASASVEKKKGKGESGNSIRELR